jgi:hypothetical protein
MGPIPLRAPRWVVEGYATLVEGRLTGSGRPSGALRAAVLRRWAQRGQLPSYGALAGDRRRWLGESMPYLGGSAFLEWLERRGGEGSLDRLWRRLTARRGRGFADAFRGVFGESPASLWGRFTAELGWQAVELEHRLAGTLRQGEPWLDRSWGTGRPALSRDGERLVVTLSAREEPPRLAVYATAPEEAAGRRAEERRRRLLARDPEDVPAVETGAPERQALATLELPGTTVEPSPRFLPDGSVLFARTLPDAEGRLRADLFRWQPEGGRLDRVTRGADLRAADPAPDGRWAAAVESRWGQTRLVRVDLATGAIASDSGALDWGEPSVEVVVDAPRVSPDGARLAYLRHRGAGWELVVRVLAGGAERVVSTPPGASVQDPAWAPSGKALLATVAVGGLLDVQELPLADGSRRQLTRTAGAGLAPELTPDGEALFFLALEPEGLQVRRLELGAAETPRDGGAAAGPLAPAATDFHPALPPPPAALPAPLRRVEVPASRPYGLGRGTWSQLSGGVVGAGGSSLELGARGGDVVGRWDLLALAALGSDGGTSGAALAGAWRGSSVEVAAHAFAIRERPSRQRSLAPDAREGAAAFDLDARGAELAAAWARPWLAGGARARVAAGVESLEPVAGARVRREGLLVELAGQQERRRGRWRGAGDLDLAWQAGRTGGAQWDRRGGRLELELARGGAALSASIEQGELGGRPTPLDLLRVGGQPSSLLPSLSTGSRRWEPALPAVALVGRRYRGERLALLVPGLPLGPFWARHRVESTGRDEELSLAGVALDLELPPLPVLDLPAARLSAGVATLLDAPYRHDIRGWLGLSWRP